MAISFNVSKADAKLIRAIVERAHKIYAAIHGENLDRIGVEMDLTACHANGTPLRLADLLAADDFNFSHDVWGIRKHIDRRDHSPTGGKMLDCFLPRFFDAKAAEASAWSPESKGRASRRG